MAGPGGGRPCIRKSTIVNEIYDKDFIINEQFTLKELFNQTSDDVSAIEWFAKRRLLINSINCEICKLPCRLNRVNQATDKWRWVCNNCRTRGKVRKKCFNRSVRVNSFFSGSHLTLQQILTIIYMWCQDYEQKLISWESGVTANTISDWCHYLREVCEQVIENNPQQLGGLNDDGSPKEVEIDENRYFYRKRGQWPKEHWVFGAIERGSGRCCLIEVPDRRPETLIPIIRQWILPGTRIISDGWAAYADIANIDDGIYMHDVTIVEKHDEVNTQLIKNTWMRYKKKMRRQCGSSEDLFPSYIAEFLWRNRVGENKFGEMLCSIVHYS